MGRITNYRANWFASTKVGVFKFFFENGTWSDELRVNNVEEFSLIIDLLRNEKPLYYSESNKSLSTFVEPVGEGE